jgi:3-hydroxyisobutyrate dehydrogenase
MRKGVAAGLVGGDAADIEAARPALDAFLERVYVIGTQGTGAALKVINNAVAHAVMVVLVEAAALATASGIDRSHLLRLMTGNDAGLTRPLEHRLIERIAQGNYEGGMPTAAALKDSILAIDYARSRGVPIFAISGSHAVYEMATAQGFGRLDYAAIAKLWEEWIGKPMSTQEVG